MKNKRDGWDSPDETDDRPRVTQFARIFALAGNYQLPVITFSALVIFDFLHGFRLEILLALLALSALIAMGVWAYCFMHIMKKKGIRRSDRIILLFMVLIFHWPACLFYLHSQVLYGDGQENAQSQLNRAYRRKVMHLVMFCIAFVLVLIFLALSFNPNR